jgi:uncharacterized protein YegP (UPF0339 family)
MNPPLPRFEYWNTGTQWYWHLVAGNGYIIADGSEGYDSEYNVKRAIANFVATVSTASGRVVHVHPPNR